ncbi:MAG: hypothetical protein AB7I27_18650 [Bacteriovoracaceae bacterium]
MDKKKNIRIFTDDDIRGFEEFLEDYGDDITLINKNNKKDPSFENFTFLTDDSNRLTKIKLLLGSKLPFSAKHGQGEYLIREANRENEFLRKKLLEICDNPGSGYRKSLSEIFDSFFGPAN